MACLKKGTIVTCPMCGNEIAVLTRDIFTGEIVASDMFEWTAGNEILYGDDMNCLKCEAAWFDGTRLHVKDRGWVP